MAQATTSLRAARLAKAKLSRSIGHHPDVRGVGIARVADGYGLKVNLARADGVKVPIEVDGVPVRVETVGRIVRRQAAD